MRRPRTAAKYARMSEFRLHRYIKEIVPDHNENWKLEGAYLRLQGCTQILFCIYTALVVVFLLLSTVIYLHLEKPGTSRPIEYVYARETSETVPEAGDVIIQEANKQPGADRIESSITEQGQYAFTVFVLAVVILVMPYPVLYRFRERYKEKNAKEWIAMEYWIAGGMEDTFLVDEWLMKEGEGNE